MHLHSILLRFTVVAVAVVLAFGSIPTVDAAETDEVRIKARAVSTRSITRTASDMLDIRITGWTGSEQRAALIDTLQSGGNQGLAAALNEEEAIGWVAFDPRGGGGPGRHPRQTDLKYSREVVSGDQKEIILVTNHYPGYSSDARAADGAKLTDFPVSFILLKLQRGDDGEWTGIGRMFVGARLKFDTPNGKFVIDEFPMDPVYLKDVKVK